MALPKLNTPEYELELPSTGGKIKYRPFLVKEQKLLMMAQESEDETQISDAVTDIIDSCTNGKLKAKTVTFLFQKILDNLERNDWSKFTIERFQPRLSCETKRGKDQKMKWIAKCVEKGQISRANKCLMSEHSNVQNAEEVVESIKNMIKSTRKAGCGWRALHFFVI